LGIGKIYGINMHILFIICAVIGGALLSIAAIALLGCFVYAVVLYFVPDFQHSAATKRWQ
jgi:hypothetical protein